MRLPGQVSRQPGEGGGQAGEGGGGGGRVSELRERARNGEREGAQGRQVEAAGGRQGKARPLSGARRLPLLPRNRHCTRPCPAPLRAPASAQHAPAMRVTLGPRPFALASLERAHVTPGCAPAAAPAPSCMADGGSTPPPSASATPRVLSIQSHVVSGYVGNKVSVHGNGACACVWAWHAARKPVHRAPALVRSARCCRSSCWDSMWTPSTRCRCEAVTHWRVGGGCCTIGW